MNKLTIIGNLTKDPELRTTQSGISVCSFTVAVNRRRRDGQEPETDYFRVTAWRQLAEICAKFTQKGKKVAVTGPVSVSTFTGSDGTTRASLDVTADDIEFLSPRVIDLPPEVPEEKKDPQTNWTQVSMDTDELPF
jgi:single-strand DNA-binding protein